MSKKVAILQSNYIPWKGYFDLIASVDEFIIYDCMQYTKRDWRNRNKIKTIDGLQWLTIPVQVKGKYFQSIKNTKVSDSSWAKKHWKSLKQSYSKSKYFSKYEKVFEDFYSNCQSEFLSEINYDLILIINKILGIKTKISFSKEFPLIEGKSERLLSLCQAVGATEYISGPAAKDYLDEKIFENNNIKVTWMDYSGYPEYDQIHPPFEHGVTVLDLIFNQGPEAPQYMKSQGN
ncbi:hypothetical protein NM22_15760 [Vibrio tubiashii]|nr:hypothetical protein NM22_15760 [Vibrio tubiashii]